MRSSAHAVISRESSPKIVTIAEKVPPGPSKSTLADVIFGRRLATAEEDEQKIGPVAGVPVLGLDALSSAAYGPEAALTLLLPLGALGLSYIVPLSGIIVAVLLVVYFSYRQTIAAYPNGGGSYTVAKENLGQGAALVAGAALALDYVLNVAVGISAGVGALVSAVPALLPHTLLLCLAILVLLTLVNLRGTRESGLTFLLPTYLFVASLAGILVYGGLRVFAAGGHPVPVEASPVLPVSTETVSLWLVVRAFASGCTAMTGVEAVSNGVPLFRRPTIPNAQRTLTVIIAILVGLLGGIALLARAYGIGATPPGEHGYQSVLSQLACAVIGRGPLYYITMGSVVAVLALSANTSFADFPRLCRVLALDRFLPDTFATRGRRLVFSYGVVVLAVVSGFLLVAFGGVTDRLIPLFAIGAFLAFTISQAGMVAHWRRAGGTGARRSLWINALGATATGITLVVVIVSKFADGAWIAVVVVPLAVFAFARIHRHYRYVGNEVKESRPLDLSRAASPLVVVPVQAWNKLTSRGLRFAIELSPDVRALHIVTQETEDGAPCELARTWETLVVDPARAAGLKAPRLVVRKSTFRQFFAPLIEYIEQLRDEHPDRDVVVIVPDLVVRRWYHALLHNNRGIILKGLLRLRGGPRVVVVNTPFYLT
ncbi:APC family permease [Pendulispora rubella]|uniref:APC family permease n=1 Tax=Pendulispora rubella TaxID=2741070 RepID=A0ABZ2L8X3_9BACT